MVAGRASDLKGILKFCVDLIEQSVMVSGIVYVLIGFVVRDCSCTVEFTTGSYGSPTGALTFLGCSINFSVLVKIG